MRKPLVAALFAVVIAGAGAAPSAAEPRSADTAVKASTTVRASTASRTATIQAAAFAGTVPLSNCPGSVIRFPNSADSDPALVLTNGHCLETGFPKPGEVIVGQSSSRSFGLLNSSGSRVA